MYKRVILHKDRVKNVTEGHPWIFSGAILSSEPLTDGELCEIHSQSRFVGIGYYHGGVDIAIRLLTRKEEPIDAAFFEHRIRRLKAEKEMWVRNTNAYRVVFGESDALPGLIVDKYDHTLVIQCHTLGMERLKDVIALALTRVYQPKCVCRKTAVHSGRIEGLAESAEVEILHGKLDEDIIIEENGFRFFVNVAKGQKTGFFLDQRQNRQSILPYCEKRRVLNCFCYTGGFSVYAASVAARVTSVDISGGAIQYARRNFELNGFDPAAHEFVAGDVFDYLAAMHRGSFDTVILDPPSFARKKVQIKQAIKAYTTINSKALEKMAPGSILISSSCTTHVDELTFIKILNQSAINAGCSLKVLHSALQPFDHAYNLNFLEGRYLKFFVMLRGE
jgi:23S rRNA (cytosine1962-C5)-methyltransferase